MFPNFVNVQQFSFDLQSRSLGKSFRELVWVFSTNSSSLLRNNVSTYFHIESTRLFVEQTNKKQNRVACFDIETKKINLPFDRERQCAVAGATETDLGQRNRVSHDAIIDVVQIFGTQSWVWFQHKEIEMFITNVLHNFKSYKNVLKCNYKLSKSTEWLWGDPVVGSNPGTVYREGVNQRIPTFRYLRTPKSKMFIKIWLSVYPYSLLAYP